MFKTLKELSFMTSEFVKRKQNNQETALHHYFYQNKNNKDVFQAATSRFFFFSFNLTCVSSVNGNWSAKQTDTIRLVRKAVHVRKLSDQDAAAVCPDLAFETCSHCREAGGNRSVLLSFCTPLCDAGVMQVGASPRLCTSPPHAAVTVND